MNYNSLRSKKQKSRTKRISLGAILKIGNGQNQNDGYDVRCNEVGHIAYACPKTSQYVQAGKMQVKIENDGWMLNCKLTYRQLRLVGKTALEPKEVASEIREEEVKVSNQTEVDKEMLACFAEMPVLYMPNEDSSNKKSKEWRR